MSLFVGMFRLIPCALTLWTPDNVIWLVFSPQLSSFVTFCCGANLNQPPYKNNTQHAAGLFYNRCSYVVLQGSPGAAGPKGPSGDPPKPFLYFIIFLSHMVEYCQNMHEVIPYRWNPFLSCRPILIPLLCKIFCRDQSAALGQRVIRELKVIRLVSNLRFRILLRLLSLTFQWTHVFWGSQGPRGNPGDVGVGGLKVGNNPNYLSLVNLVRFDWLIFIQMNSEIRVSFK